MMLTVQAATIPAITVLLVEDDKADARLLRALLSDARGAPVTVAQVERLADAVASLQDRATDVILLDLSLPDANGLDGLRRLRAVAPRVPIVVMGGLEDERLAHTCVQEGALDYLLKGQMESDALDRALRYAIEHQRAADHIDRLTYRDTLTGLPNRLLLRDRLTHALDRARRQGQAVAVLFLDIDGFKRVNTTLGHEYGDILLHEVGRRLVASMRESDTVARVDGDEFAIILPDITREYDIPAVARQLLDLLSAPFALRGHDVHVTASVGISLYPSGGHDVDSLLKNADMALYRAKEAGTNRYEFFTEDMTRRAYERFTLEHDLRDTIARGALTLHYQPVVTLRTGSVCRVETLVRWPHPRFGLVFPDSFIPIAEQTGAIAALTEWVLNTALAQSGTWKGSLTRAAVVEADLGLSVNLAARTLYDPDLPKIVARLLERHTATPAGLTLEVKESAVMADAPRARDVLARLAALGVRIALDDFGAGHSSLSLLKHLPVHEIKIDRALTRDLSADINNAKDAAIVCSIIGMARALDLEVVAEGVEDQGAYTFLHSVGCDAAQGYHVSRPLPASHLRHWLSAWRGTP